jgi:hypothetical protein
MHFIYKLIDDKGIKNVAEVLDRYRLLEHQSTSSASRVDINMIFSLSQNQQLKIFC